MTFQAFNKIPRLNRDIVVTEKIDGTNASVIIVSPDVAFSQQEEYANIIEQVDDLVVLAGSRSRYITPANDNFGFAAWVAANAAELVKLGEGQHFGEWWGKGIQRNYGLDHRKFSLFNATRWGDTAVRPACCDVVPIMYQGDFDQIKIDNAVGRLIATGSVAVPGYMDPEGIIIYHTAANQMFKVTCKDDNKPKTWQEHNKENAV